MSSTSFCPGTGSASCRSGRGGGPARLAQGRHICGTCSRRAETRAVSTSQSAAAAALAARPHQPSLADAANSYRERKRNVGIEPSGRTLLAVRTYVHYERQRKEHLGANVPREAGRGRRGAPLRSDWKQQVQWLDQMDRSAPDGMVLNAYRQRNGDMVLTFEGPFVSSSECCDAPIRRRAESGDETTPHSRSNCVFNCDDCGEWIEPHEFARYTAKKSGGHPPRLVMPLMDEFTAHAIKSRGLLKGVLVSDALVDANERLDEFLKLGGSDDVITGDLDAVGMREGTTGIRLMDELQASTKPEKAIIQGWTVVDTHEGKTLHCTSLVEVDRDAGFERCLRPASDFADRLP